MQLHKMFIFFILNFILLIVFRGTTKEAVLFSLLFCFVLMVNCLVCLQCGMLTLLMLHPELEKKVSK